MAVYVDELKTYPRPAKASPRYTGSGERWCHLTADSPEELHTFAARLRLSRCWAQHEGRPTLHYDLTPGKRTHALRLGAIQTPGRERAHALIAARKGEEHERS